MKTILVVYTNERLSVEQINNRKMQKYCFRIELFDSDKAGLASGALIKSIVDQACLLAVKRAVKGMNNGVTEEDIIAVINTL